LESCGFGDLNIFEKAEAAMFRAIEKRGTEASKGASTTQTLQGKYVPEDIPTRIEISLTTAPQENRIPLRGQLLEIQCGESDRVGSLTCLVDVTYVLDIVFTYLTPKDVARLEQTCRRFAANPERSRRLALGYLAHFGRIAYFIYSSTVVSNSIRMDCNENLQD
jgi:hypothetical protein